MITVILPVFAPAGTVAWIVVALTTLNTADFEPPNVTFFVPTKPPPTMLICAPTAPLLGSRFVITGKMCIAFWVSISRPVVRVAVTRPSTAASALWL